VKIDFTPPVDQRDFGWAVRAMKNGHRLRRGKWDHGAYVELRPRCDEPDENGMVLDACLTIFTGDVRHTPWTPGNPDILAEDWELA
jgi:hypothetical protein